MRSRHLMSGSWLSFDFRVGKFLPVQRHLLIVISTEGRDLVSFYWHLPWEDLFGIAVFAPQSI